MAGEISKLKSAGARNLVCSPQGRAWLEANPSFVDLTAQMLEDRAPERVLKSNGTYIGIGNNSDVMGYGGTAVKLSTPNTGKKRSSSRPENLINQFHFLGALKRYLDSRTSGSITTPDQYLAFRTPSGDYLKAEEHMEEWISVYALAGVRRWLHSGREGNANETVKGRINNTVADFRFRLGLSLGLERTSMLHSKNVLVPSGTVDLESAPLCIIDQPSIDSSYLGKISVALTRNYLPPDSAAA